MSFVGPRPLLEEYLEKYSNYEKKRHLVKPGITGLAQVNPESSGVKSWNKSILDYRGNLWMPKLITVHQIYCTFLRTR